SLLRNIAIFAAKISADQTQHRLHIRPRILERISGNRRRLARGFLEQHAQAFGIVCMRLRVRQRTRKGFAPECRLRLRYATLDFFSGRAFFQHEVWNSPSLSSSLAIKAP